MYHRVKLAPLKGSTKEEMSNVQLKSLTELFLTDPMTHRDIELISRSNINSEHNNDFSEANETTAAVKHGGGVSNNRSSGNNDPYRSSNRMNMRSSRTKQNDDSNSTSLNNKRKSVALGINDVNCLWTVYLNQQLKLGVDISDRQAMAKSYHDLNADQVQELKDLKENDSSIMSNENSIPTQSKKRKSNISQQRRGKQQQPIVEEPPRKIRATIAKAVPKSVNKRQQRKKKIRDELKRQLSTFTTLSETEGFPWKAIVSKSGFRNLKLVGWPRVIPRLKRIDDFNPVELDLFEDGLDKGSIKIIEKKK